MKDITVSFSHNCVDLNFTSNDIERLKQEVADRRYHINQNTLTSFGSFVGKSMATFCPATFKTDFYSIGMSRDTFEQMQLFVLEFDNRVSFDEIMNRARMYQLSILLAYETVNDRFRVVFLNDVTIRYIKIAEVMIEALLAIFPEADVNSKDVTQVYSGGRKLLHIDRTATTINIELLFRNLCLYWKDQYGINYRRKIYDFSKRTGIALNDKNYLDVSISKSESSKKISSKINTDGNENSSPNSIIYKIDFGEKYSISHDIGSEFDSKLYYQVVLAASDNQQSESNSKLLVKKHYHREYRSTDFTDFRTNCQLLKEFENGTRQLTRNELFGLSTVLINIETGSDKFIQNIRKNTYWDPNPKQYSDWQFYLNYLKKTSCVPLPCNQFCPYKNQCCHAGNITASKLKYHEVKKVANYNEEVYPVDVVAAEMRAKFDEILSLPSDTLHTNINAINAPTGAGKSTMVLKHMADKPQKRYIVAYPTVDLKNQNYEKAIALGIKAVKTPSLMEYKDKLPPHVWNYIQSLYQTGKYRSVPEYIREVIANREADADSLDILKRYLEDVRKFYKSNCNVLTTHSMLAAMDYWILKQFDAVIVDEDPLLNHMIANQVEIPLVELEKILLEVDAESGLGKKISAAIKAAKTDTWITLPSIPYEKEYGNISVAVRP